MIVFNKTKSIITLPVDHRGTQVVAAYPGWSEIADQDWFAKDVDLTDEGEIRGFGKKVQHGAELSATQRIGSGDLEILGEAKEKGDVKGKARRSLTISEVDAKKAAAVIAGCNRSDTLKAWKTAVGESLRMDISNRLDELKQAAEDAKNPRK